MPLTIVDVENAPLKLLTKHQWLRSGAQTMLTHPDGLRAVREIQSKATDFHSLVSLVNEQLGLLQQRNQAEYADVRKRFRTETVNDFFNGDQYFACGGQAIASLALFRALGVPAKYVERLYKDGTFSGHVVCKIRHPSGKWVYFDSTKRLLAANNQHSKILGGRETVRFREGLDSHDIGIKSDEDLRRECDKLKKQFEAKTH
ncbi:MAG: transglutaminase-like domain-containing protein [Candidatus Micrarchaeota archaeon]